MSSRSTLLAGSAALLALGGVLAYTLRAGPDATNPAPSPAAAASGATGRAASDLTAPSKASTSAEPTARAVVPERAPEPPAAEAPTEPENPEPPPPTEPPKPSSLEPVFGGEAAFAARHAGSSYEQRAERLSNLEAALALGAPEDETQVEAYTALKEELYWLRDHLGAPPPAPK